MLQAAAVQDAREEFARLYHAGELTEARALAEAELGAAADDTERLRWLNNIVSVAWREGQMREARALLLSASSLARSTTDTLLAANYFCNYGLVLKALGDYDGARSAYEKARALYRRVGNQPFLGGIENNIASLLVLMGKPAEAHPYIDRARHIREHLGNPARVAEVDDTRALAYEAEGDFKTALRYARQAVDALMECEGEEKALEECWETHDRIAAKLRGVRR